MSTCYAVGGMPLAFTQEEFLGFYCLHPKDGGRLYFQSVHTYGEEGTPSQVWVGGGYPIPGLGMGGTPARSGWWGVPHPRSGLWGVPHPWGGGGYPGQVWMVWGEVPGLPPPQPGLDGGGGTPPHPLDRAA